MERPNAAALTIECDSSVENRAHVKRPQHHILLVWPDLVTVVAFISSRLGSDPRQILLDGPHITNGRAVCGRAPTDAAPPLRRRRLRRRLSCKLENEWNRPSGR
jgi:hypothetical protein